MYHQRLFKVILAFQNFAGKPLKCDEAATELSEDNIMHLEISLRKMSKFYKTLDPKEWPELHRLAEQIDKQVPPITFEAVAEELNNAVENDYKFEGWSANRIAGDLCQYSPAFEESEPGEVVYFIQQWLDQRKATKQ